jgi:TM2 domain-containing membrane protein YozV
MPSTEDRFGVRLAAPPGLGPEGVQEIAAVLSPVTGRPTAELATALTAGPIVVHTHISESDARQLVQTFRALGARADVLEAVDPLAPNPTPQATRPLFAIGDAALVDKAWRHVTTGARPAINLDGPPLPKVHEIDTRRMQAVSGDANTQTQPLRSMGDAARTAPVSAPPAAAQPATSRLTMTPAPSAGAIFRPQAARDAPTTTFESAPTPPNPAQTQPIDPALLTSAPASATTGRAGPAADLATVRFEGLGVDATAPMRIPTQAQTQELSTDPADHAETRPFQRHEVASVDAAATQPMSQSPVTVRQHGPMDSDTIPRGQAFDALADANTGRFGHDTAANLALVGEPLDTGSIGSVQAGPKIFQLPAPPVGPTETGNLPVPARLEPLSDTSMRIDVSGTPLAQAAQASELAADAPRPGVYQLPSRRRGAPEPSVLAEPPAPPPAPIPLPPAGPAPTSFPAGNSQLGARAFPAGNSQLGSRPSAAPTRAPSRPLPQPAAPSPAAAARAAAAAATAEHSPGTAAWMSVLVPGLGQVYNGQRERGILFALGTPLIVPYLFGIYDAFKTAEDIARGKYAAPDPHSRQTAFVGQLALGLVMIFGTCVLALILRRPVAPAAPAPVVVTAPVAPAPATTIAPTAVIAPTSRAPIGDALDVPALMKKGRMACNQGLFSECEEIMHEVIARDPGNRDAYNLLVEAAQQRKTAPPAPDSAGRP